MLNHVLLSAPNVQYHFKSDYDVSSVGIEQAVHRMELLRRGKIKDSVYTLYVTKHNLAAGIAAMLRPSGDSIGTVLVDPQLEDDEWYLKTDDIIVLSRGV